MDCNLADVCRINRKDILDTQFDEKSGKLIVELASLDSLLQANVNSGNSSHCNIFEELDSLLKTSFPVAVRGLSLTTSNLPNSIQYQNCDFASRYFSPWNGIPEDPVNGRHCYIPSVMLLGSSHTILGNFYKKKLNKTSFLAFMASERTGYLNVTLKDLGRVAISGFAVTTLSGAIRI